jgi:hypothetical protein
VASVLAVITAPTAIEVPSDTGVSNVSGIHAASGFWRP